MRTQRSPEELRHIAKQVEEVVTTLRSVADQMDGVKMPAILVHGNTPIDTYIPHIRKWAAAILVDLDSQAVGRRKGEQSKAARDKERALQDRLKARARKAK